MGNSGVKIHLVLAFISENRHEQVASLFPLYLAGLGADMLGEVWFLGKYYFPFVKQNHSI